MPYMDTILRRLLSITEQFRIILLHFVGRKRQERDICKLWFHALQDSLVQQKLLCHELLACYFDQPDKILSRLHSQREFTDLNHRGTRRVTLSDKMHGKTLSSVRKVQRISSFSQVLRPETLTSPMTLKHSLFSFCHDSHISQIIQRR